MIIHNDDKIKIEYNEQFNSSAIPQNAVGATASTTLRTLDFTPSNDNAIFVSKTGSDSGVGTLADPVLTINRANELVDVTHARIVILDSENYNIYYLKTNENLAGMYAAIGETPTLSMTGVNAVIGRTLYSQNEYSPGLAACYLSDGNLFLLWHPSEQGYLTFRVVDKDDFSDIIAPTTIPIYTYNDENFACCLTADGNVFVIHNQDNYMHYLVISTTTWQVIYDSGSLEYYHYNKPVLLDNGNILLITYYANGTNNGMYYAIINGSTYALGSLTLIKVGVSARAVAIDPDGNISIVYGDGSTYSNPVIYYRKYTQAMVAVVGETLLSSSGMFVWGLATWDDYMVLMYTKAMTTDILAIYYKIINSSYLEVYPERSVTTGALRLAIDVMPRICASGYGTFALVWNEALSGAGDGPVYYCVGRMIPAYVISQSDLKYDGFKITVPTAEAGMERLFLQGGDLTIKHTTVHDIPEFSTGNCMALTLNKGRHAFTFQNVLMRKNILNMLLESDDVIVNQSIFFANRKNPSLEIDGAGAGISLTKNTFFNNYGAIKLLNNDGNEIVNDSIFHDNLNYDVNAETALTVNNSISTGLMIVAVLNFANCLQADPRFINDGFIDENDLNVDIRLRVLGYPCDSPAYKFASDGENSGAIDVLYNYVASTYDTCLIQKPEKFIVEYRPVGAVKNIMIDGTVNTAKQGQIIAIIAEWKGILEEDWESLHDVWLKGKMVRLYPDPITHPEQYRAMRIEFSNIQGSTDYYGLDGDGKQNIKMVFAARYLDV
ncbi:MAG: hypothetical protein CVV44_20380 [Spirochaetae bacterium HGW-Spirochaetae-1]|jgi:hypothetical protein|nr:MAG: hypothetical protein CVV44_20380 [Spirochaetae bacterium HGW-Spirochaetae-1]